MGVVALVTSACSSNLSCEEPQAYQFASETERVVAPDDLDQLQASRETPIPKASPRDPRPPGSPCIDLPPTVKSAKSASDNN